MGREALVWASVDGERAEARALLESHELILRGGLRHRFDRSAIREVAVTDGALTFHCGDRVVRLELGQPQAEVWHRALLTPPPTLRDKLGLGGGARALVIGPEDEPALVAALADCRAAGPDDAAVVVARVDNGDDLDRACRHAPGLPLWVVHAKGKTPGIGDTEVRTRLRAAGWRDTKTCAVSARFSATRYHPPRGSAGPAH